jgi:hypothetical protein
LDGHATDLRRNLFRGVFPGAVVDRDAGAAAGELARDRRSDAARSARDESDLALE